MWFMRGQISLTPGLNSSAISLWFSSGEEPSQGGFCWNYPEILRRLVSKPNLLKKPKYEAAPPLPLLLGTSHWVCCVPGQTEVLDSQESHLDPRAGRWSRAGHHGNYRCTALGRMIPTLAKASGNSPLDPERDQILPAAPLSSWCAEAETPVTPENPTPPQAYQGSPVFSVLLQGGGDAIPQQPQNEPFPLHRGWGRFWGSLDPGR